MARNTNQSTSSQNNDEQDVDMNYVEHDENHPYCWNDDCLCREDEKNMGQLEDWHYEGLIGSVDGDLIYHGKTI